jgi:fructose 1,6-bisphosphate aldolase/phosphatase
VKRTLSIIQADIGSICGHIETSRPLLATVDGKVVQRIGDSDLAVDHYGSFTGDDSAIFTR